MNPKRLGVCGGSSYGAIYNRSDTSASIGSSRERERLMDFSVKHAIHNLIKDDHKKDTLNMWPNAGYSYSS